MDRLTSKVVQKRTEEDLPRFFPIFPHFHLKIVPVSSLAEDEEDGAAEAEGRPDEVESEFFAHEEHGERHEDGERDDFLHDLQLGERERGVADAVRGHLQKVFEQRNAPADNENHPQKRSFSPFFPVFMRSMIRVSMCRRTANHQSDSPLNRPTE